MAKAPEPAEPFATWPVQYVEPSVGYYWYFEPATLICQSYVPHGTFEIIERHNDVVDRVLARHRKSIEAAGGLFMLFDWRSVRGYDQDARARQRERMQARGKTYARRTVVVIHPANRLLSMAVSAHGLEVGDRAAHRPRSGRRRGQARSTAAQPAIYLSVGCLRRLPSDDT
jgi:hypothetical protein